MTSAYSILYASHTPALKGSTISLSQLILGLDRARFSPTVAFSKPGYLVEHLGARGIPCHVLKERGFLGWKLVSVADSLMERAHIELVHLNSAVPFCKYVGIAAKIRRRPVVWHIREDPGGKRVRRLKKWIRLLADRVVVVSSELEKSFKGFPAVRVYNGVDVDRFNASLNRGGFRDRFRIPGNAFLFGIVGTVEERKGSLAFLKAAEALLGLDFDAHFAVVGDGMAEDMRIVRNYLSEHQGLSSRVVFTGRLENIPEVMSELDVLVMPSLWEGFPRSLIEAMACGRAAIASDVGEISFILEEGKCGFVVPSGDHSALVQAMVRCLSDRQGLQDMGRRARERVVSEFSLDKHVELIQNEYLGLLAAPRGL